ncbi:tripartite tricarboxylate transporter substrate-binding protein [Pseudaquabacterium pictum]|uniref:MFS transporter n=1 Tax=Pseudaquabacterium pictum TaxID=2315236 RepID=A0A480AL29_9BURK|nr:tripartite tricarboxylate transporter substrate-binding protein [Rubrivivax pictus]GCL62419.1 MFS transporter [Rubrivivax pictus]
MSFTMRRRQLLQTLAASAATGLGSARADTPESRVLYGFAPGTSMDDIYDVLAVELRGRYRPTLPSRLTHLPGQSGSRALRELMDAPADGSVAMVVPTSLATLLPQVRKLPADPRTSLQAVASIAEFTFVLCVGKHMPPEVQDAASYVKWVKDNPGRNNYGLPGLGSAPHLLGLQLGQATGLNLRADAYPGTAPLLRELQEGGLPAALVVSAAAVPLLRSGAIRALAVTSKARWPGLDTVPTLLEQGIACTPLTEAFAMFLPAKAPAAKADELAAAIQASLRAPQMAAQLLSLALAPGDLATGALTQHLADERDRWRDLIARVGFKTTS